MWNYYYVEINLGCPVASKSMTAPNTEKFSMTPKPQPQPQQESFSFSRYDENGKISYDDFMRFVYNEKPAQVWAFAASLQLYQYNRNILAFQI